MSCLDNVIVAAPCPITWESMVGDDRVRHCSGCDRNVYNLSDMSTAEAEKFITENGDTQCARLFRRADGKIMTDNCPRGLRAIRNKCKTAVKVAASIIAAIFAFAPTSKGQAQSTDAKTKQKNQQRQLQAPQAVPSMPFGAAGGISVRPAAMPQDQKKSIMVGGECTGTKTNEEPFPLMSQPKHGDLSAYNLYRSARQNVTEGKMLLAQTQFIEAIETSKKQAHADAKFIEVLTMELNQLRSKLGLGNYDSQNPPRELIKN
ncbi:MAG: hypothetical protein K2X81_22770 [Candidatus Obscuribacterales bacterium]|nr:hypothetical protein [Candidatus Obscuribacterales bacterium]